jgi:hypothetical protein
LQPAVLNRLARSLLPRLKMEYVPIQLRFRAILGLWAVCLVLWVVFGAGFVLFARSLAPIDFSHGLLLMSNYAISWLVGVITIFAPGGIGVREGILGLLLGKVMPLATAFLIAVVSRLWLIGLELLWASAAQIYFRLPVPAPAGKPGSSARDGAGPGPTDSSG